MDLPLPAEEQVLGPAPEILWRRCLRDRLERRTRQLERSGRLKLKRQKTTWGCQGLSSSGEV